MKIGYSVEGSTDRALVVGLRDRWCPSAHLIEGLFRGNSGLRRRLELPKICTELAYKGVDMIILLRDANEEDWRVALRAEQEKCHPAHRHLAVFGVCSRNVESWICSDADWIAQVTGRTSNEFRVEDPKGVFSSAMQITGIEKREAEIAKLISHAPLKHWLRNNSFEAFYDFLRQKSIELNCSLENIRESVR
jgi:hypothetical protein